MYSESPEVCRVTEFHAFLCDVDTAYSIAFSGHRNAVKVRPFNEGPEPSSN